MLPMAGLRELYASLGHTDIATYVQSGNIVCRAKRPPSARPIEDAIERRFGFRVPVVLRSAADLREIIARNPFPSAEPAKLLVWFLADDPGDDARRRALALADPVPEGVRAIGRELFIHYTIGMARPKLNMTAVERALGVPGTGRNWNTVRKLCEMAASLEAPSATAR